MLSLGFGRSVLVEKMPRKAEEYTKVPVPQTDTGGWVEYTKAREWTLLKELGNLAP